MAVIYFVFINKKSKQNFKFEQLYIETQNLTRVLVAYEYTKLKCQWTVMTDTHGSSV